MRWETTQMQPPSPAKIAAICKLAAWARIATNLQWQLINLLTYVRTQDCDVTGVAY